VKEIVHELTYRIDDAEGICRSLFDFSVLTMHPNVARAMRSAMQTMQSHNTLETQRQTWRMIRKFALFLEQAGLSETAPLPTNVLVNFRRWLEDSELVEATASTQLTGVQALLNFCDRNSPGILAVGAVLRVRSFQRKAPPERNFLTDETQVKKILAVCYSEIEAIESKLTMGHRILMEGGESEKEKCLQGLMLELLHIGNGQFPTQKVLNKVASNLSRRVFKRGGLRELTTFLWITPRSLLPYYVAVGAQTAGNPSAIAKMKRDCITSFPLRSDLERITWFKPRGHADQHSDFPVGKKWSTPAMVRSLMSFNEDLVSLCKSLDRHNVFIAMRGDKSVGTPCAQMWHLMLNDFIDLHQLPPFDFKDLRSFSAKAHQRAGGTIAAAKKKLNHRSASTTLGYVGYKENKDLNDSKIRHFQGELIRESLGGARSTKSKVLIPCTPPQRASTVFGFDCRDPFAGLAPGSVKGVRCMHFDKCATCHGAIVPLDDPMVVAKLLAAKTELEAAQIRAKKEGWLPRFDAIYLDSLKILESELFPSISKHVLEKASAISFANSIPRLD